MALENMEIVVRLLLSAIIAGIIGWEREHVHKPAGLRTHMLVAVGSTLITLVSLDAITGGDPGRIAAGIVTGIGFLGAGTIFRDKNHIRGLTTAASVWAVSGLGIALGAGYFVGALVAAIIIILTLHIGKFEKSKIK